MIGPEHVLFVDVKLSTVDKYYLNTKDGRTTTRYRDVVANYGSNDHKKVLLFVGLLVRTHVSIKNFSVMDNEELTPNVLNRILEAIPSVKHESLIHCRQFKYEPMCSFDGSDLAPNLYLECDIPHNFTAGTLFNGNSPALMWVYIQRYRSRMTGEPLEQEEDPDDEYLAYEMPATPTDTQAEPWYEKNHMIGIGAAAESLLGSQIKTNPNFLRHCSGILLGRGEIEEGAGMIQDLIMGKTDHFQLATRLNWKIGPKNVSTKKRTLHGSIAAENASEIPFRNYHSQHQYSHLVK